MTKKKANASGNFDLFGTFKTDANLERGGNWFMLSENTGFLVRRNSGANLKHYQQVMAKHYLPIQKLIESDTLSEEKDAEISATIFSEACLVDWKGVEKDGELIEFSQENAVKLLVELPELFIKLDRFANNIDNYKKALGNS